MPRSVGNAMSVAVIVGAGGGTPESAVRGAKAGFDDNLGDVGSFAALMSDAKGSDPRSPIQGAADASTIAAATAQPEAVFSDDSNLLAFAQVSIPVGVEPARHDAAAVGDTANIFAAIQTFSAVTAGETVLSAIKPTAPPHWPIISATPVADLDPFHAPLLHRAGPAPWVASNASYSAEGADGGGVFGVQSTDSLPSPAPTADVDVTSPMVGAMASAEETVGFQKFAPIPDALMMPSSDALAPMTPSRHVSTTDLAASLSGLARSIADAPKPEVATQPKTAVDADRITLSAQEAAPASTGPGLQAALPSLTIGIPTDGASPELPARGTPISILPQTYAPPPSSGQSTPPMVDGRNGNVPLTHAIMPSIAPQAVVASTSQSYWIASPEPVAPPPPGFGKSVPADVRDNNALSNRTTTHTLPKVEILSFHFPAEMAGVATPEAGLRDGQRIMPLADQSQTIPPFWPGSRDVARQLAVGLSPVGEGGTEIILSPQELGRVRLTLLCTDGAIAVQIIADRPETADLMRRHIDSLAQEFRALGYQSVSIDFGPNHERGQDTGRGKDPDSNGLPASGGAEAARPDIYGTATGDTDPNGTGQRTTQLDLRM